MTEQVSYSVLLHYDPRGRGVLFTCIGEQEGKALAKFKELKCEQISRSTSSSQDLAVYNDNHAESLIRSCLSERFTGESVEEIIGIMKKEAEKSKMPLGVDLA